jgi:hypothetical protein
MTRGGFCPIDLPQILFPFFGDQFFSATTLMGTVLVVELLRFPFELAAKKFQSCFLAGSCSMTVMLIAIAPVLVELS